MVSHHIRLLSSVQGLVQCKEKANKNSEWLIKPNIYAGPISILTAWE